MKYKDILVSVVFLAIIIPVLMLSNDFKIIKPHKFSVKIPAVVKDKGILTTFYIEVREGVGRVFTSIPPIYEKEFSIGYLFSKEAACKLYEECNDYDYLFYSDDVIFAEGFSGTAGFYLLIAKFFERYSLVDYPITGFMLPNGIVASIGGVDLKLEASLEKGYDMLVAPKSNEIGIVPAFTILDINKIYFNKTYNTSIYIPKSYKDIIKNITLDICKDIEDTEINNYILNERYYTAASLCFSELLSLNISYNKESLQREIERLYETLDKIECNSYLCEEVKYNVINRLNVANSSTGPIKYARYKTAVGWMQFMNIKNIDRRNTCDNIKKEYEIIGYFYNLPETDNCFDMRENLAKLYYSLISYRSIDALRSINNLTVFYMNKNGVSISALNYLEYSEDLFYMGDIDSSFYYAILALEYAV